MAAHVFYGSGAPTSTPTAVGQHYVDTLNGTSYLSVGTTSSSDWKLAGAAGSGSSAIAIGTSIISGSSGSILFVGNGLAQDNANLFYDDANNQLIINAVKTNTTLQFKDALSGGTLAVTVYAPTLAAGYTLRLPVNDGAASEFLQTDGAGILSWAAASGGAGSSQISIGMSVASGTSGSILFIGDGIAQDNANLFYDDANNQFIANAVRTNSTLQFKDSLSGGTLTIQFAAPSLATGYSLYLPPDGPTTGMILGRGSSTLNWVFDNRGLFGRGTSGDITYSVDTTLGGNAYYNNITVNSGVVLSSRSYLICALGTLTNEGTIRNNGTNGATISGGAGALTAYWTGGGNGGNGSVGTGVNGATVGSCVLLAQGGGGGNGSGGNGGTGGIIIAPALSAGGPRLIENYVTVQIPTIAGTATKYGFGSGGGGGGGDGTAGGGGGGAAGHVFILAKTIAGSGVIEAMGGDGGTPSGGNRGGGGGGAGGLITVISTTGLPSTMTTNVASGLGGTGTGTGTNGNAGATGSVNQFIMQGIT